MSDKRPRGAPKKSNPASGQIHVRCTPDQKEKWTATAKAKGLAVGTWLKNLADKNS